MIRHQLPPPPQKFCTRNINNIIVHQASFVVSVTKKNKTGTMTSRTHLTLDMGQRATTVTLDWNAGRTRKIHNKWHTQATELLCGIL